LKIKSICDEFLRQIEVPFKIPEVDPAFYADCCRAARDWGIPLDGTINILPYLRVGTDIAELAYGHTSHETQIYVALFTAAMVGCEDACASEIELLNTFGQRFIKGQKHGNPILDSYDLLLRELAERFEPFAAGAMLQSALDFIVGLVLEYELKQQPTLARPAQEFPIFLRILTGVSRLYTILMFPDGIPLRSWMESLPSMISYIHHVNDIFSFYKEELVNECNNFISIKAQSGRKTKLEALQSLADETVDTVKEIIAVLAHNQDALEAFKDFHKGYVYFHTACNRYKMAELWAYNGEDESVVI
ncbi:Isoprenoid synthase domain containing protein, partial [Amanita muscaria]